MSFTYGIELGDCEYCGRTSWLDFHSDVQAWLCEYCWEDIDDEEDLLMEALEDISFEDLDEDMIGDYLR